jgi:hypothetical protein
MKINILRLLSLAGMFQIYSAASFGQQTDKHATIKDSVIYHVIYRDTIIYKHDTVTIKHYVYTDTIKQSLTNAVTAVNAPRKRRLINPNAWGIGPSVGAYYSPFNGFDVNIGFGVQYYFLAIPNFRNPHMKTKRARR